MVKRKASVSLDEWLCEGTNSLPINPANPLSTGNCETPQPRSTAEGLHYVMKEPISTDGLIVPTSEAAQLAADSAIYVSSVPVQLPGLGLVEEAYGGTSLITSATDGRSQHAIGGPFAGSSERAQPMIEGVGNGSRDEDRLSPRCGVLLNIVNLALESRRHKVP